MPTPTAASSCWAVEELADKSFRTVDLPDPEKLIKEFWDIVNNPNKTSVNVLSSKDVFVQEVDGNHIVVINVPRAERSYKAGLCGWEPPEHIPAQR